MSHRGVNLFAAAVFFGIGFLIGCSAWTPQTEGRMAQEILPLTAA